MTTQTTTETVTVTIDGYQIAVPKGTLVIRAAEMIGISIPRFCDHPLLDPIGACRQCLVDIEGQRKPLASCTTCLLYTSDAADDLLCVDLGGRRIIKKKKKKKKKKNNKRKSNKKKKIIKTKNI